MFEKLRLSLQSIIGATQKLWSKGVILLALSTSVARALELDVERLEEIERKKAISRTEFSPLPRVPIAAPFAYDLPMTLAALIYIIFLRSRRTVAFWVFVAVGSLVARRAVH